MNNNKTEIMAQIVALLSQLIDNGTEPQKETHSERSSEPVEMLTIKECAQAVSGLSEHEAFGFLRNKNEHTA